MSLEAAVVHLPSARMLVAGGAALGLGCFQALVESSVCLDWAFQTGLSLPQESWGWLGSGESSAASLSL